jgi:hypothetical protein
MTGGPVPLRGPDLIRARIRRGTARGARPDDRLELASLLLSALLVLLAVPVALAVATTVATDTAAQARQQQAERSRVPAVLLEDATTITGSSTVQAAAPVVWTAPDGSDREGTVTVPVGTSAGETVRIWTDAEGRRTGEPLTPGAVRLAAVVSGVVTVLVAVAGSAGLHAGVCALLDRSRAHRWAREWDEVEPLWAARFRLR